MRPFKLVYGNQVPKKSEKFSQKKFRNIECTYSIPGTKKDRDVPSVEIGTEVLVRYHPKQNFFGATIREDLGLTCLIERQSASKINQYDIIRVHKKNIYLKKENRDQIYFKKLV